MTELVKGLNIRVTFHEMDSAETRGHDPEWWLRTHWNAIGPLFMLNDQKGSMRLLGGAIEIQWEHTGLTEIPEETGGDN